MVSSLEMLRCMANEVATRSNRWRVQNVNIEESAEKDQQFAFGTGGKAINLSMRCRRDQERQQKTEK